MSDHAEHVANARLAYRLLAAIPNRDDDLAVALARIDEWVGANEGRLQMAKRDADGWVTLEFASSATTPNTSPTRGLHWVKP